MQIVIIGVLLFVFVLAFRAWSFKPMENIKAEKVQISLDEVSLIDRFSQMIRIKTVSFDDISLQDEEEFKSFRKLLVDNYPNVNKTCELHNIGRSGVLYHWKGKSSEKPVVFMAHYDVVPARESQWDKDPFCGDVIDGYIWGRGTLDTKGTLFGIMESTEQLISEGFIPENDVYLSFSGDEETNGYSTEKIVEFLEDNGIIPYMVLDEGGAIVQGVVPGVKERCALIGTGEKGKMHLRLSTTNQGGHASSPPAKSPIGRLASAVVKIEKRPFKFHISQPVKDMFNILGRNSNFSMKIIFANMGIFAPLLDLLTRKTGGELNALMRTTTAFTKMEGSNAVNVFPPYASIEGDIRIMEGDTGESIIEGIKARINDDKINVECVNLIPVRSFSNRDNDAWNRLEIGIKEIWGDVLVSPYLMIACSDSRHFTKICDNVYRFSAMELDNEERKLIHGNNERIQVEKLLLVVKFYINLMKKF